MPVVGMLTGRVQPRWLIAFGFTVSGLALFHMTGFTLQIDYRHAMLARCFQTFGLAFLFIPINTLAYSGLPPGKNNNASALLNVSRNIGASFGIAMVITMLARRSQFHHQTWWRTSRRLMETTRRPWRMARTYCCSTARRPIWRG